MALVNVPLAGQNLLQTRDSIAGNFSTIDTAFLVDHVDYAVSGQGKHEKVTLVTNSGATFLVTEMGLFNNTSIPTGNPEIFVQRGTGTPYPMTGYVLGGTNPGNGWTYLPSGLLMAWGRSTTGAGNNVTITYATELTNFPGFTTINAFPQLTRISGAGTSTNFVTLTAYNQTTFQVYASAGGTAVQFCWLVLGI